MSSSDSNEIPMGKLIPKKLKKKNYFSSKYGKISEKSSSEDSDDGGSNDKVNEEASTSKVNEGASSSINTFGEKDGLVFTNSDFNVTCKDIGFKKQTKFDVENNNYQIEFEPKQGKSQMLLKSALEGIIASLTKILNDLQRCFNGNLDRNFHLVSKNTLILRLGA